MYWPDQVSNATTSLERRGGFSLSNIACGFLGGNSNSYDDGVNRFCGLVLSYTGITLEGAEWVLNDVICQDNNDCTFIVEITMAGIYGFAKDGIPNFCPDIFEEIWNNCNGGAGGSANILVSTSSGRQTGVVTAQYYAHDSGATCPASLPTDLVCGASLED